jgi:hypothetical protein
MLADTAHRVEWNTAEEINRARREEIGDRLRHYAAHKPEIPARLAELDREWDIERAIEANAATVALVGLGLAAFVDRRFIALPAAVAGFLLQHAIQGWCPPVPILRRLGFRTATEIGDERHGLMTLQQEARPIAGEAAPLPLVAQREELHEGVEP